MQTKPVLEQNPSDGVWSVRLEIFEHKRFLQYTPEWSVTIAGDFRDWLRQNDPGCEVALYNLTTLIVTFATEEGAFAFRMRYC